MFENGTVHRHLLHRRLPLTPHYPPRDRSLSPLQTRRLELGALYGRRRVRRVRLCLPRVRLRSGSERLDRVRILGGHTLWKAGLGALCVALAARAGGAALA